jgi:glutamyl-tRNA reductase
MGVRPVIRALQEKAESVHQDTLESLFNKLPELDERQRKVISRLTKSMLNQMMHDPINSVKELAVQKQGNEALELFSHIFALEDRLEDAAQKVDKSDASALMKPEAGIHEKSGQAQASPASFAPAGL